MESETSKLSIQDLRTKIKKLKSTDVNELNTIIDQLNASQSFVARDHNMATGDMLGDLAKVIPSKNDHLLSKFCSLLYYLLHKQRAILSSESSEILLEYIINAIRFCGEWVRNDVLIALSELLYNNAHKIEKFTEDLAGKNGVLINLLPEDSQDKSVQLNVFQCLTNLVKSFVDNRSLGDQLREEIFLLIYQKCLLVLKEKFVCNTSDILTLKVMINSLKCLQQLFESKTNSVKNFGELLGSLKSLLFYGLPGQSFLTDVNLQPTLCYPDVPVHFESQSESDSPFTKLRKQKKNKRRVKKNQQKAACYGVRPQNEGEEDVMRTLKRELASITLASNRKSSGEQWIKNSSSDSELSDAESHISKVKALQASVRQNAYLALQSVFKNSDKKVIFGYWSSFLPEHPTMPGIVPNQNIFTTILKDPNPQVRLSALSFLAEILRGSKPFLSLADGRNVRHMSFTSLSSILATMIIEIHRCLLLTLLAESSNLLLTQILKCYAVLAENVPYFKLDKDILKFLKHVKGFLYHKDKDILKFLKHVKGFLYHKDVQVQVASLAVFGAIINSDQTPVEIEELMLSEDFEVACGVLNPSSVSNSRLTEMSSDREYPWIVELCRKHIYDENPLPIKIQSLQLLSNMTGKYFNKSRPFFPVVYKVVLFCVKHDDKTMQLHGLKLLDVLGRCMNNNTFPELTKSLRPMMSVLWEHILMGPLVKCINLSENHKTLQCMSCDCLSTVPANVFESVPPNMQIIYVTLLLGLARDPNPNVRGAAIRCLGIFCVFPCLAQDPSFLNDVSVILIRSVNDFNVTVRFKASWALGNLSDSLFLNRDQLQSSMEISPKFFHSTGMACVKFAYDNDRVRANAVRALGNFMNYIPQEFINMPMMQEFIRESCDVLKSALTASFMKVCWNACYAVRNMFKNVYLIEHGKINLEEMLNGLLKVLKSPNFKVRISASQALTSLTSRELYGNLYCVIWQSLVSALMSISADVNFKEINHQENLCDQLCFSLCQLTVWITSEDIALIGQSIPESREILLTSMWKFGSRLTVEKNKVVSTVLEKLIFLKEKSTTDEEPVLTSLHDIFNQSTIAYSEMANNDFVKK